MYPALKRVMSSYFPSPMWVLASRPGYRLGMSSTFTVEGSCSPRLDFVSKTIAFMDMWTVLYFSQLGFL